MTYQAGILDTNVVAALSLVDPRELPEEFAITAITLGELSNAPHATSDPIKRARRMAVLQHAEATFDVLPYDAEAARFLGQICAAVYAMGRQPRSRMVDLMIAATAAANQLPLFTANPKDFAGLDDLVEVVAVTRPVGAGG